MKEDFFKIILLSLLLLCCLSNPLQQSQEQNRLASSLYERLPQNLEQNMLRHENIADSPQASKNPQKEEAYVLPPTILAETCPQANCATCTEEACTECESGYTLIYKTCVNNYGLLGCAIFTALIGLFLIVKCVQAKRRAEAKDSALNEQMLESGEKPQYALMTMSMVNAPRALTNKRTNSKHPQFILYHNNFLVRDEEQAPENDRKKEEIHLDELLTRTENAEVLEVNGLLYSDYTFNAGLFMKIFLINLTNACGIGIILIPLYGWIFKSRFVRNTYFLETQFLICVLGFVSLIYLFYAFIENFREGFFLSDMSQQAFGYFEGLLFLCIVNAAISSHINEKISVLLHSYTLDRMDATNQIGWNLVPRSMDEEAFVEGTISKLNIDAALFYMEFLEKTPDDLKRVLEGYREGHSKMQDNVVINDLYIFQKEPVQPRELAVKLPDFEKFLFELKFVTKPCRFDEEKAFGYQVARDIIRNVVGIRKVNVVIFVFNLISYFVFFIGSLSSYSGWFSLIGWLLLNFVPRLLITVITCEVVMIITRKLNYLRTLSNMICTNGELEQVLESKKYPILNIFDFQSLKTWFSLRKIFIHTNDKRLESLTLALGLFMVYQLAVIAVLALCHFGILKPDIDRFNPQPLLILYTTECSLFAATLFCAVFYGAQVNNQFALHRNLINNNKTIVMNMFRLYPSMIGENGIRPGTFIYNKGFEILRKDPQNLDEKLKVLLETYESILKDLKFEEAHSPFRLFGLPVKGALVKSLGTLIVSLATPLLKQLFTNFFSK